MGPTKKFLFGLIINSCFHHSKLKNLSLSDGNRKQEIGVFSFWELSFSGIFVKLSKEWDPPIWLVPSSNVSLQPVLLCLSSFFIFFSFTQSSLFSLTLHCSSISHHHHASCHHHKQPPRASTKSGLRFFSLSFLPLLDQFLSKAFFLSHIPFAKSSPSWATTTSHHEISSNSAQIGSSLCLILWFRSPISAHDLKSAKDEA